MQQNVEDASEGSESSDGEKEDSAAAINVHEQNFQFTDFVKK